MNKQSSSTMDLQREADVRAAFLAELIVKRSKETAPQMEIIRPTVFSEPSGSSSQEVSPPPGSPLFTAQLLQEILDVQRQSAADLRQIRNAIAAAIIFGAIIGIIIALN